MAASNLTRSNIMRITRSLQSSLYHFTKQKLDLVYHILNCTMVHFKKSLLPEINTSLDALDVLRVLDLFAAFDELPSFPRIAWSKDINSPGLKESHETSRKQEPRNISSQTSPYYTKHYLSHNNESSIASYTRTESRSRMQAAPYNFSQSLHLNQRVRRTSKRNLQELGKMLIPRA